MKTQWYSPENPPESDHDVLVAYKLEGLQQKEMGIGWYEERWNTLCYAYHEVEFIAWTELPDFPEEIP